MQRSEWLEQLQQMSLLPMCCKQFVCDVALLHTKNAEDCCITFASVHDVKQFPHCDAFFLLFAMLHF